MSFEVVSVAYQLRQLDEALDAEESSGVNEEICQMAMRVSRKLKRLVEENQTPQQLQPDSLEKGENNMDVAFAEIYVKNGVALLQQSGVKFEVGQRPLSDQSVSELRELEEEIKSGSRLIAADGSIVTLDGLANGESRKSFATIVRDRTNKDVRIFVTDPIHEKFLQQYRSMIED